MSTAKGDVEIKMEFTTGKAAAARSVINSVYQNTNSQMAASAKKADVLGASMRRLGRSVLYGVAGFAGVSGVSAALNGVVMSIDDVVRKRADLENALIPLSSLGTNAQEMARLRKDVVDISILTGRTNQEISQMFFNLQSSTASVADEIRGDLKVSIIDMARATGGDLATATKLSAGVYKSFGKEIDSVTEATNKLMRTQDQASLEFADLAQRFMEIGSMADLVKISFDEALATVIAGTQSEIPIEKFFTGLRNVFLIIDDMEKQRRAGINLTGDYITKLSQLQQVAKEDSQAFKKLFGQESVVVANVLASSVDDITRAMEDLDGVTGDVNRSLEIIRQRLEDPVHAKSIITAMANTMKEQIPNMPEGHAARALAKGGETRALSSMGFSYATGGMPGASMLGGILPFFGMGFEQYGRETLIRKLKDSPERDVVLQDYERQRVREINASQSIPGGPGGMPPINAAPIQERSLDELKASFFDAEVMERSTKAMNRLADSMERGAAGGGRANSSEALN